MKQNWKLASKSITGSGSGYENCPPVDAESTKGPAEIAADVQNNKHKL